MYFLRNAGIWAGLTVLAACQTAGPPAMSLEEAKQATAEFEKTALVPPPRTINDITAILDRQKLTDPEETGEREAKADAEPPAGAGAKGLARFYLKRGAVARKVGRSGQALEDLRRAAGYAEKARLGRKKMFKLFKNLAEVESAFGNNLDAIDYMEQAIASKPGASAFRGLVQLNLRAGDLDAAERTRERARGWMGRGNAKRAGGAKGRANRSIESARMDFHLLEAQGHRRRAETALRRAIAEYIDFYGEGKSPSWLPTRKKQLAGNLRKQGRLVEAEIVAREALLEALARIGRDNVITADIARQLSTVLLEQGRYEEAERLGREVLAIHLRAGTPRGSRAMGSVRKFLIHVLAAREDWPGAIEQIELTREEMKDNRGLFEKMFSRDQSVAVVLLGSGKFEDALSMNAEAHRQAVDRFGAKHGRTAKWGGLLAIARAETGDRKAALDGFRSSVPVLLSRSRESEEGESAEAVQGKRVGMILEAYIDLLADIRGTALEDQAGIDAAAEAFRIADVARGRSVQRALAASGARATAGDPELAAIARREQDTQKQIATLYALLADVLSAPSDQQDPEAVATLRQRIDRLRGARAAMMEEIESRFPDYAGLINPKPATVADARSALRPGEALIATYVGADRTYVWAVPGTGEVAFAAVEMGAEDLVDQVGLIRAALEPQVATLGDIPEFDLAAAYDLYRQLLEPVKAGWTDAASLLVVAHGSLGYLPLSLLPTADSVLPAEEGALFANYRQVPWLVRTHAVTVLPSVASLRTLRGLPAGKADRKAFAGFGDPWFSPAQAAAARNEAQTLATAMAEQDFNIRGLAVRLRAAPDTAGLDNAGLAQLPRLPDTAEEVRAIALTLEADPVSDVFLGARASEGTVKSIDLSGTRVVAFATHGLVPGDLDGLTQPALALSAPDVANDPGNDGLLTMGEILGLKLDADWVVLSACNTGSGSGAGAEAVSGLGRAFFYAGTRALLVSNWPVETTSAKTLTTELFRRQAADGGLTRAEALRQAMLSLIDGPGRLDAATERTVFSYAHPIFWAPFSLIGDGG